MLCACSGEQFKIEDPPQSPQSLATRDFSASGLSSRTGDWESKFEDTQVDEVESTLKEALSLNYEEARALLGRLEYQRGNYDAALQVFQGIDIKVLTPRMKKAITERTRQRKPRSRGDNVPVNVLSLHSVSLLLEAIFLKARSLEGLGRYIEAAKECKIILDIVESALPNGMREGIADDCKLQEMFHKALELQPDLWIRAGLLDEAIAAYRRALMRPWNLHPQKLVTVQKELASILLYGGLEASLPLQLPSWAPTAPKSNMEEAILLLLLLMRKVLPGVYARAERWYFLALCYAAAGHNDTALNLLKKISGSSEAKHKPHVPSLLLGARLCSQGLKHANDGVKFAREVIELGTTCAKHFSSQAHKFLGICYGNAARVSVSDSERILLQRESLNYLNHAVLSGKDDPEIMYNLALENAVQRNLEAAFESALMYSDTEAGNSGRCCKLLTLILSSEQRYIDAESVVDFALDEAGKLDQLELLRLKAVLQITREKPQQAIETYRILLAMIQAQREIEAKTSDQVKQVTSEAQDDRNLEISVWQDLALLYARLGSWADAETCLGKAKSIHFYSPRSWHTTGLVFEAQSLYKEALVSFSLSLSLEPDYVPSIISTAEVLMKLGSHSLPIARSFLMSALRKEPTNHEAWFNLGKLSKMEGSLHQAADFFQAAYELQLSAPIENFV
ncbi:hypothetical protein ACJRO7_024147 [Eucalyptus globulus]|uniref:Uncharacterized protein n=1 Tax=Eucalyptus globulus TaxID=34317 RepID=A0ABD3K6J4_EUCGL